MPLRIITYPHPTLRHVSKPVGRIDAELRRVVAEMFELMYRAKGVGLAANQVDLPLRLFVANSAGNPEEGEELVVINPVISQPKGNVEQEEGCLSIPGVYATVRRAESVRLTGFDLQGNEIDRTLDGLFARVVQHETDHLDGILFIDRLSETSQLALRPALEEFELEFQHMRRRGQIEGDEQIQERIAQMESRYAAAGSG